MKITTPDDLPLPEPISVLTHPDTASTRPLLVGFRAARANLFPGLCVQAFMLLIVYAYYRMPQTRPWFDRLGECKRNGGYIFTLASAMVAGALMPAVFTLACVERRLPARRDVSDLFFACGFYGFNAVVVDSLYRGQNVWFGTAATVPVLVKKVLVDQFIYNPVFAAPFAVLCFAWKNRNDAPRAPGRRFTSQAYFQRVLPTLLATWTVWIPVVAVLYSLPPLLQIPIYSLVLCFWALMLAYIHTKPKKLS